jgi:hypothetical protein
MEGAAPQPRQDALLGNIYVNRMFKIGHGFGITPHLLLSGYTEKGIYDCFNADPSVTFEYNMYRKGKLTLESGIRHQYLSQTGISNVGLPIEFWVAAGRYFKPQSSRFATLSYDLEFLQSKYAFSIQAYAKRLENQTEYTGFIYDLIARPYRLEDNLLICSGYNYGLNVMINKTRGRLTGWVSYSYGRALRRFSSPQYPDEYPSSHERIHEIDAVASMKVGKRWSLGGTFVAASGTPFTAPQAFYVINGRLLSEYGQRNANRLKPYVRLDLSANYYFKKSKDRESGINISVYNVLMHSNDLFYRLKFYENKFGYRPFRFFGKMLPSINYFYKF